MDFFQPSGWAESFRSEYEAEAKAEEIFQDIAGNGSEFIYLEHLLRLMSEDEALETLSLFEGASNTRKISKSAWKKWAVDAYNRQTTFVVALEKSKTLSNKVQWIMKILLFYIAFTLFLLNFEIITVKYLLGQFVLLFIFGDMIKSIFGAIIFLFVMTPFGFGDWCRIDGVLMLVEEIGILDTIFIMEDGSSNRISNNILATKQIQNYSRSSGLVETIEFCVDISATLGQISAMKEGIASYVGNKKEHWSLPPKIMLKSREQSNMLKIVVTATHVMALKDMGERNERRSLLVEEIFKILHSLGIESHQQAPSRSNEDKVEYSINLPGIGVIDFPELPRDGHGSVRPQFRLPA